MVRSGERSRTHFQARALSPVSTVAFPGARSAKLVSAIRKWALPDEEASRRGHRAAGCHPNAIGRTEWDLQSRKRIEIQGVVQGVGFRPFVYRAAQHSGVSGYVLNCSAGVVIEAEGDQPAIGQFLSTLPN